MRRVCSTVLAAATLLCATSAAAQLSDNEVRVGLLTDLHGIYSDIAGQGAVIAAEMAIEDFREQYPKLGAKVRLIVRDHQSDGKVAARLGRKLVEEGVDVFAEMVSSSTALPLQKIAHEHNVVALHSGAASSDLTGKHCSPLGVHWAYDTYALAGGTGQAMVREGKDRWFFLTADYAFGHSLERDTGAVVESAGGAVLGAVRHPFKGDDFGPYLRQARASGAQVVALANAGGDTMNAVRQAYELGLAHTGQDLAALLMFITDVRRLGLYVAGGLKLTTGFYWNYDEQTRAWSERFYARAGAMPTMVQASVYSSLMHYLKAVQALGSDDGRAVVAKMKELPVSDFFSRNAYLRADGRMIHDMYLVEVKKPSESQRAWDYLKVIAVTPGEDAFRPMEEGGCPHI
ncbi:ABC transporter substrate-binding protein [Alkalilimnicola sp. S0819]|uniref:ABC transporter substrate-binding protein n=1 Tax=Alkalilimnicola sp. S0819 TaxID=2613922 RepID=UPI001261E41C|nr:ABC transporter substrate-binding protein [Alkalilimnicola sp. S0819]KAB7628221.1 ABC transporter substrate-binding protein [Alkalilimnicola sp. S0819]MPQ15112.1 ABC transporter substrate-binding protein [Alkalilimnicola sp. S0819]